MGMTIADAGVVVSGEAGGLSPTVSVGAGIGGVFATVALIYTLAYFDLVDAAEEKLTHVKQILLASIFPLSLVFLLIVVFEFLQTGILS